MQNQSMQKVTGRCKSEIKVISKGLGATDHKFRNRVLK